MCSRNAGKNGKRVSSLYEQEYSFFVDDVTDVVPSETRPRFVDVEINGRQLSAKIDSGAEVCVVPRDFGGIPNNLEEVSEVLMGPNDKRLNRFRQT